MNSPLVSVIILNFNGKRFLRDCLESVINSTYQKLEIIMVDNGSTDGSVEFVKERFPHVKLLKLKRNLGFAGGNNAGIKNAQGEIIFLLNNDTTIDRKCIENLAIVLTKYPKVAIVGCKIYFTDTKIIQHAGGYITQNGLGGHYGYNERDIGQYDKIKAVDYVTGAAFAFKREIINEIGLFDQAYFPLYYEEKEFCLKAKKNGYEILYVPTAILFHQEAATSGGIKSNFFESIRHKNRIRFIIKNFNIAKLIRFPMYELYWALKNLNRIQQNWKILIKAYLNGVASIPKRIAERKILY